jgi:hypothetical protein
LQTASYSSVTGRVVLHFSEPLMNVPSAVGNWVLGLSPSGNASPSTTTVVLPQDIRLQFAPGLTAATIRYDASPPDVVGANGVPVAAFEVTLPWP